MGIFDVFKKKNAEALKTQEEESSLEKIFLKNGFDATQIVPDKQIKIDLNGHQYTFPFETNRKFYISEYDVRFAVAIRKETSVMLFIYKNCSKYHPDDTSEYRTYYSGLMTHLFSSVYPFNEEVFVHVTDDLFLHGIIE